MRSLVGDSLGYSWLFSCGLVDRTDHSAQEVFHHEETDMTDMFVEMNNFLDTKVHVYGWLKRGREPGRTVPERPAYGGERNQRETNIFGTLNTNKPATHADPPVLVKDCVNALDATCAFLGEVLTYFHYLPPTIFANYKQVCMQTTTDRMHSTNHLSYAPSPFSAERNNKGLHVVWTDQRDVRERLIRGASQIRRMESLLRDWTRAAPHPHALCVAHQAHQRDAARL